MKQQSAKKGARLSFGGTNATTNRRLSLGATAHATPKPDPNSKNTPNPRPIKTINRQLSNKEDGFRKPFLPISSKTTPYVTEVKKNTKCYKKTFQSNNMSPFAAPVKNTVFGLEDENRWNVPLTFLIKQITF